MRRFMVLTILFALTFGGVVSARSKKIDKSIFTQSLTPDQMLAARHLEKLVRNLTRQGKNRRQIYLMITGQTKRLFEGNITFDGKNSDTPWTLGSDGKLHIYALTNSRDQVLAYVYQLLMLTNDPIYMSKRAVWMKITRELTRLKKNLTFEADHLKVKNMEKKIESLSGEIIRRQTEIFS